jgi:hypothetical protein
MWLARYYFRNLRPFYHGEVLPCGGPLVPGINSELTFLICVAAREYDPELKLPGIACSLAHLVGVTEDEFASAQDLSDTAKGIHALYRVLCNHGIGSCTVPDRPSLAKLPGFLDEWRTELASSG